MLQKFNPKEKKEDAKKKEKILFDLVYLFNGIPIPYVLFDVQW